MTSLLTLMTPETLMQQTRFILDGMNRQINDIEKEIQSTQQVKNENMERINAYNQQIKNQELIIERNQKIINTLKNELEELKKNSN